MSGGRVFGPTDWPGHDAQGERIEGGEGVDVKERGDMWDTEQNAIIRDISA